MFGTVIAELDEVAAGGFVFGDTHDAIATISDLEVVRRKVEALTVAAHAEVDRSGVYRDDGHASAKVMVRHVAKLSPPEAAGRARAARMSWELPELADALRSGRLGVAQFDVLGRVHANPRVRNLMADAQDWFLERAARMTFTEFEKVVRRWERLADMDGAAQANARRHENRNATLVQDHFELSWWLRGNFGSMQGATIDDIFAHYIDAERLSDWEKARAEHGDDAIEAHLPRTEAQRRADALWQIFQDAASAESSAVPPAFCHDIVWDHDSYERMLRRLDGEDHSVEWLDPDTSRCETIDGVPVDPHEAAACSLVQKVRRVIVDAAGVTIDLGRARCFTGSARKAVQLADPRCPWPGCRVRSTHCEIDHTVDHARGGRTDPGNGAPFCGRHNRWKQKGFTVWRDPTGQWHIHRPDGSEIV